MKPLIILASIALIACTEGKSTTGYEVSSPDIEAARDRLRPHYPEAANYPTIRSEKWPHAYGVFWDKKIYLSQLWADKNASDPVWGSCLIYHEFNHSIGIGHGKDMNDLVNKCRNTT